MESVGKQSLNRRSVQFWAIILALAAAIVLVVAQPTEAQQRPAPGPSTRKPNILMIMADDIGWFNVSAYNHGVMGYRTPNIDRIASEGALFTDWYAEQSCTAGRAAFVTGQSPIRTGLTKVGLPGADIGLRAEDPRARRPINSIQQMAGRSRLRSSAIADARCRMA
jgi:arylsulfatase